MTGGTVSFARGREAERGQMARSRHSKDSWPSSDLCAREAGSLALVNEGKMS